MCNVYKKVVENSSCNFSLDGGRQKQPGENRPLNSSPQDSLNLEYLNPTYDGGESLPPAAGNEDNASVTLTTSDPEGGLDLFCLLYTSPSPRDQRGSRMPSSA